MNELINRAIENLASKIDKEVSPEAALKFTQSALNLAHVKQVLAQIKVTENQL